MSVARITTIKFKSKEDADKSDTPAGVLANTILSVLVNSGAVDTVAEQNVIHLAAEQGLLKLERYDKLNKEHPAYDFITKRKIPEEHLNKFFFCAKFYKWVNSIIPNKLPTKNDHPRVIIPFYDRAGKFFAFQGRAFGREEPKYITIKLDESKEKIYESISVLEKVVTKEPNWSLAKRQLAIAYGRSGKLANADFVLAEDAIKSAVADYKSKKVSNDAISKTNEAV